MKDGINDYVVHGQQEAVNPQQDRDESGGALRADASAAERPQVIRLRLSTALR